MKRRHALYFIGIIIGFVFVFWAVRSFFNKDLYSSSPPSVPISFEIDDEKLLNLINQYRSETGKTPFKKAEQNCDIAKIRLYEVKRNWSHEGFDADRFCYDSGRWCFFGEVLAREFSTEDQILQAWLSSPKHKEILDKDYYYGCIVSGNGYSVGIFASYQ